MGMDVYGKNPTDKVGEYFRRNVWGWHPLWQYVEVVHPEIAELVEYAHSNDGDGLDSEKSQELANFLRRDLDTGVVTAYLEARAIWLSELPREDCSICDNTGIRSDEIGLAQSMPEKELSEEVKILTGRTMGWCNGCDGVGTRPNWETNYFVDAEDIAEFAEFLEACGGFEIC